MIKKLVKAIVGSRQARDVRKLEPILVKIREHEAELSGLDDAAIQGRTNDFRARLAEETGELRAEVERLRAEKHDCADPIERERLFRIIEDLVLWENTNNEEVKTPTTGR